MFFLFVTLSETLLLKNRKRVNCCHLEVKWSIVRVSADKSLQHHGRPYHIGKPRLRFFKKKKSNCLCLIRAQTFPCNRLLQLSLEVNRYIRLFRGTNWHPPASKSVIWFTHEITGRRMQKKKTTKYKAITVNILSGCKTIYVRICLTANILVASSG